MSKFWCAVVAVTFWFGCPLSGHSEEKDSKDPPKGKIGNYRIEGIDVVQGRVFRKGLRHEFSVDGGVVPNNTFLMYEFASLKYTFHFREGLALEGAWWRAFHQNKSIIDDLRNIPCPSPKSDLNGDGIPDTDCGIQLADKLEPTKNIYFGTVVWSPIYGKLALFSKKIFHFDLFITGGAGMIDTDGPNRFAFAVGAGTKIFLNDWMALRFDFRNFTVREGQPFNQIANNRMLTGGLSFFLPLHPVND